MPWYKSGAVSVSVNSNAVIGTGTSFIANGRVGDAFRGPDGGWYEVTNIASDTAMSIAPAYQGATNAAGTYALAPMQGYVKESADRLRQLVEQFGATIAGLGSVSTENVVPITKGGTGATTKEQARINLGLSSAATATIGEAPGNIMAVGAGGLLGPAVGAPASQSLSLVQKCGFSTTGGNVDAPPSAPYSTLLTIKYNEGYRTSQLVTNILSGEMFSRVVLADGAPGGWRKIYDSTNTTRAADGTLKAI